MACKFKPYFIPYGGYNPKPINVWEGATGEWIECPNFKCVSESFSGEQWKCEVCGKRDWLDYEDMK